MQVAPSSASLSCPTCGYRYRRGIDSGWKVFEVTVKESARWCILLTYFLVSRAFARMIYKRVVPGARDGRPFSFNLFWPAVFLMHQAPTKDRGFAAECMLLADAMVSACSIGLKRLARVWRLRLPLLFPPPVQIPSLLHEFAMQFFCASTLRLAEILLIVRGHQSKAEKLRGCFDFTVNFYAMFYLHRELLRSVNICIRDSTKVLSFTSS